MEPTQAPLIQKFDETPLHANEFTFNWEPDRFVFDFKSVTPQPGPGGQPQQVMLVHRAVAMDAWLAKQLGEMLTKSVAEYEKKFGEAKPSAAMEQARKEFGQAKSSAPVLEKPSYYG